MSKPSFSQSRAAGLGFLDFQRQQVGGLPDNVEELERCYENFQALTADDVQPTFLNLLRVLSISRIIFCRGKAVTYHKRVIVDHTITSRDRVFFCKVCCISCHTQSTFDDHLKGRPHNTKQRIRELIASRTEDEKEKEGIVISCEDFGTLQLGDTISRIFKITNSSRSITTLTACELVRKVSNLQLFDAHYVTGGLRPRYILPGHSYEVIVTCKALNLGYIRDVLIFKFPAFKISRYLEILVDAPGSLILAPTAPYRRPPTVRRDDPSIIIPGVPLELPPAKIVFKPLPQHNIPSRLYTAFNKGEPPQLGNLDSANYIEYFSTLLFAEEIQMNIDIRQYDMISTLDQYRQHYILKVPGLAENRPSVLKGDSIYIKIEDIEYEGVVHQVRLEELFLKFSFKFDPHYQSGQSYKIRFSYTRTPLRRMHEAIHQSKNYFPILPPVLFPTDTASAQKSNESITKLLQMVRAISPINRHLNQQQMQAVAGIMLGDLRPAPYVVFGPPGTGKTMTIVEAMGQIYRSKESNIRILACAPSNNAADLLAERLLTSGVKKWDIYRFNAYNRKHDDNIKSEVLEVSSYDPKTGTFEPLPKTEIDGKKIIVATCTTAGQLYAMGSTEFTHIFVDEAGQAMEPECVVCLSGLATSNTIVVLAGDPKQLGPVIRSPYAQHSGQGLGRSLLERITSLPSYRHDPITYAAYGNYNVRLITKLVNNYRSHPEILLIPNKLFYNSELLAMADIVRRTALCNWDGLPRQGFPIIFHGMEGKDEREGNSPSFFNRSEVLQVDKYIKMLREIRSPRINAQDIGVITPYRKQADKIRTFLTAKNCQGTTVGSVEMFQGQERLIIIISCVRSNSEFIEFDCKHNLGFLKNPKRFNVAITRPQALLIVIGNPRVLVHDPNWACLLWHCVDQGAYIGSDLPERDPNAAMEQITDIFDRLRLGADVVTEDMPAEDPEWRPLQ